MNKTILEERIKKQAFNKLRNEWKVLFAFLQSNELARKMVINEMRLTGQGGTEQQWIGEFLPIREDEQELGSSLMAKTNFEEIAKKRLAELEQKELDEILNKLQNLGYLFEE